MEENIILFMFSPYLKSRADVKTNASIFKNY